MSCSSIPNRSFYSSDNSWRMYRSLFAQFCQRECEARCPLALQISLPASGILDLNGIPNWPKFVTLEIRSLQFLVLDEGGSARLRISEHDICHRSAYGRLRSATFPGFMELMRAGGGKAPFASEADLRSYLCVLFERWLAFANIVGEFATSRVCEDYPEHRFSLPGGFIVADGEIDVTVSTPEPLFPLVQK